MEYKVGQVVSFYLEMEKYEYVDWYVELVESNSYGVIKEYNTSLFAPYRVRIINPSKKFLELRSDTTVGLTGKTFKLEGLYREV